MLDPQNLTPPISLNRVRIVDLPGFDLDPGIVGHTAFELVSAAALSALIRVAAADLSLSPVLDDPAPDALGLHRVFDRILRDTSGPYHAAAETIARTIGRRLGWILLALRRGDAANRAARAEWDASYWDHWAGIRQVWLGGGLVSGAAGDTIRRGALDVFAQAGIDDMTIRVSPYRAYLPLVGAARRVPAECRSALVFDFGGTFIKRARAVIDDGTLAALVPLDPVPTDREAITQQADDPTAWAARLLDHVLDIITQTWRDASRTDAPPCPAISGSIAAYIRDGRPLLAQHGYYMQLLRLADNVEDLLAGRLRESLGAPIAVRLVHDGTAAATAHAGEPRAAVITIGTALGIGFPPPPDGLRPLDPAFAVLADGE